MKRLLRPIAVGTAAMMLVACATILYPERRGRPAGRIDVVPLIVDLLLFIPGFFPGLIALVVDFGTGAIYTETGAGYRASVGRRGALTVLPREIPADSVLSMRLLDEQGAVLDSDRTEDAGDRLSVDLRRAARAHRDEHDVPLTLEVQLDDRSPVHYALRMR